MSVVLDINNNMLCCYDVSQTVNGNMYTWKFACSFSYGNCDVLAVCAYVSFPVTVNCFFTVTNHRNASVFCSTVSCRAFCGHR